MVFLRFHPTEAKVYTDFAKLSYDKIDCFV